MREARASHKRRNDELIRRIGCAHQSCAMMNWSAWSALLDAGNRRALPEPATPSVRTAIQTSCWDQNQDQDRKLPLVQCLLFFASRTIAVW